jgi:hypothetical protein
VEAADDDGFRPHDFAPQLRALEANALEELETIAPDFPRPAVH